jgi:16S rRNA (guanine527-N7)-methyltransferase
MSRREPDRASTQAASAPDAFVPPALVEAAAAYFGERLPLAVRYASMLITDGVTRGLIGPRESARVWERHLLNCVAITDLVPSDAYVLDVGSGAGLPGIVLAVARTDLHVVLLESLARRVAFLTEVVEDLRLDRVDVVRGRAEECVDRLRPADVVTARAVAPLDRLAAWCLPLLRDGGALLAMKGASAADEVDKHGAAVRRLGATDPVIHTCGADLLAEPVTVVEVRRASAGRRRPGGVGRT